MKNCLSPTKKIRNYATGSSGGCNRDTYSENSSYSEDEQFIDHKL